ncbi:MULTISPECIES: hypothetical protein [unclassified Colwellia]|uniref:hypothetical protein n=1 Tax=unclassified Colwellia TaxID=196834 RepID=UPI0015F4486E|nr:MULTISPECIES: hypothetical protein [unclassified Colwellia]MBA6231366.1 hypothetical protein [Colwellia sp. MB02u-7]MBA6235173.1 hypothetical protein [Colwellia sp. MB02u-11]MBA6297870.1 hypothetical protein [Colwellia sp. MB3u-22]MBA6309633.1 hypothetical protein [Colwellia sp. MB3u-64]
MSQIGKKAVQKLGWVCGISLSILGFVDLNKEPVTGLIIIGSIVVFITVIATLLGKPLRSEVESGDFTTAEAKVLLFKHPGIWLGALGSIIITFTV